MARTLTWLHLSDLHTCLPRTGWDARRVLKTLVPDLKSMEDRYGLLPDLIFFTGDLAYGNVGTKRGESIADQFSDAQLFLESVRNSFSRPISVSNVFLIPGNHDVNRNEVTPEQTEWLDNQKEVDPIERMLNENGLQLQRYMERLFSYKSFLQEAGYAHLLLDQDRVTYANIREFHGIKVGIAGLNSAWSCCREDEKAKLWLGGRWQIENLLGQLDEVQFSIALIHHPVNWFRADEDPLIFQEIEKDFAFCLHGHEHQAWVHHSSDGHVRIASAACYDRSDRENGYSFVRIDLDSGSGEVWLRHYDRHGGGWIPRIISGKTDNDGLRRLGHLKINKRQSESPGGEIRRLSVLELLKSDPELLELFHGDLLARIQFKASELMRGGRVDDSISYYEKAIRLGSNDFFTWTNLGFLYDHVGRYEQAIEANRKAVEIGPSNFTPRFNLAVASLHAERPPLEVLDRLLEAESRAEGVARDPMDLGRLHLFKGHSLRRLARDDDALIEYDLAVAQFIQTPRSVMFMGESYKSIGDIYAQRSDKEKALEQYDKALEPYSLPAFEVRHREVLKAIEDLEMKPTPVA